MTLKGMRVYRDELARQIREALGTMDDHEKPLVVLVKELAALQSQYREDALRYQWLRKHWFTMSSDYTGGRVKFETGLPRYSEATEKDVDAAIDHARRAEGDEE